MQVKAPCRDLILVNPVRSPARSKVKQPCRKGPVARAGALPVATVALLNPETPIFRHAKVMLLMLSWPKKLWFGEIEGLRPPGRPRSHVAVYDSQNCAAV